MGRRQYYANGRTHRYRYAGGRQRHTLPALRRDTHAHTATLARHTRTAAHRRGIRQRHQHLRTIRTHRRHQQRRLPVRPRAAHHRRQLPDRQRRRGRVARQGGSGTRLSRRRVLARPDGQLLRLRTLPGRRRRRGTLHQRGRRRHGTAHADLPDARRRGAGQGHPHGLRHRRDEDDVGDGRYRAALPPCALGTEVPLCRRRQQHHRRRHGPHQRHRLLHQGDRHRPRRHLQRGLVPHRR